MSYLITVIDAYGNKNPPYAAIGAIGLLMDAAYDDGAFGVTVMPVVPVVPA